MTLLNSVPTACYLPSLTSKWGEGRDVTSILLEGSSTLLVDGYNGDTRATNRERSHMLWDQELERERERENCKHLRNFVLDSYCCDIASWLSRGKLMKNIPI